MQYAAAFGIQPHRQEIIANLDHLVRELLEKRKAMGHPPPAHIIYLRDGVGESQYQMVRIPMSS